MQICSREHFALSQQLREDEVVQVSMYLQGKEKLGERKIKGKKTDKKNSRTFSYTINLV